MIERRDGVMEDKEYEIAFEIILHAGNAKNNALAAMREARTGDFAKAQKLLTDAEMELRESHKTQTGLLQEEAQGKRTKLSLILVHAQDHLSTAIFAVDLASEYIEGFKFIYRERGVTNENLISL